MSIDNTTGALTLPYDWTTEEAARNAASSAKFQEQDDALRAGLNNLLVRGAVAGTANAVELTASNDVVALIRGMKVHFKALATSTAAATFNLNGTGALPLVKWTGSTYAALAAGDIALGRRYDLTYDEASGGRWCVASASSAIGESLLSSPDATSARTVIGAISSADAASAVASTAIGQGKHVMAVLAGGLTPRGTNGPNIGSVETSTNKVRVATLDFDAATAEYAQIGIPMPKSWNEGTITAQFVVSSASGTGGVVFGLRAVAVSSGDPLDAAFGTGQTATVTVSSAGYLYSSAETAAITIAGSPAEGDVVWLEIYRDATNGADTLATDARLHAVKIFYTLNAATEA